MSCLKVSIGHSSMVACNISDVFGLFRNNQDQEQWQEEVRSLFGKIYDHYQWGDDLPTIQFQQVSLHSPDDYKQKMEEIFLPSEKPQVKPWSRGEHFKHDLESLWTNIACLPALKSLITGREYSDPFLLFQLLRYLAGLPRVILENLLPTTDDWRYPIYVWAGFKQYGLRESRGQYFGPFSRRDEYQRFRIRLRKFCSKRRFRQYLFINSYEVKRRLGIGRFLEEEVGSIFSSWDYRRRVYLPALGQVFPELASAGSK